MIDSMTVVRDAAQRLGTALAAAGVTGWAVVTDGAPPRVADARVVEMRLVSCSPVVNGLSTYRLDCQLVLRGRADNEAQAAVTAADVSALFAVAQRCMQGLPGGQVTVGGEPIAQYLDSRLDQLASGVLAESMQVAPVGALALWVHFADDFSESEQRD